MNIEQARMQRYRKGESFEEHVHVFLNSRGLHVERFGVEHVIHNHIVRARVKTDHSPFRYLPDFLVTDGKRLIAAEAKSATFPRDGRAAHQHMCDVESFKHLQSFEQHFDCAVLFIFADHRAISLQRFKQYAHLVDSSETLKRTVAGGGSGQPFYTVNCGRCTPIDDVLAHVFTEEETRE